MLVPLLLCGTAFSLIEALAAALHARGIDVPIYVLSPVANACLTLANVMPEWVEPQRQVHAPLPPPVFPPSPPRPLAPSLPRPLKTSNPQNPQTLARMRCGANSMASD